MRGLLNRFPSAIFPTAMAAILLAVEVGSRLFGAPGPEAILVAFEQAYRGNPKAVILVGAFLETAFMVSFYLPGSFVIFLAVYFSGRGGPAIYEIILLASLGVFSGLVVNYTIGRFGLSRFFRWLGADLAIENMRSFMKRRSGMLVTFLAGAHPNFIGVAMVVNGIAKVPSFRALGIAALAVAVWVPAMILVAAAITEQLRATAGNAPYVIVAVFAVWAVLGAVYDSFRRANRNRPETFR